MARRAAVPPTPQRPPPARPLLDPRAAPGRTAFSDEPDLYSIKQLIAMDQVERLALAAAGRRNGAHYKWGPKRGPGKWRSPTSPSSSAGIADIEPWYNKHAREDSLWKLCGFTHIPAYQTVWERFAELEQHADAFERAAAALIQRARGKDARVGAWWHVDATEAETHAAPQHDCLPHEPAPRAVAATFRDSTREPCATSARGR